MSKALSSWVPDSHGVPLSVPCPPPPLSLKSMLPTCRQGLSWVNPKSHIAASSSQSLSMWGGKRRTARAWPSQDFIQKRTASHIKSRVIPPADTGLPIPRQLVPTPGTHPGYLCDSQGKLVGGEHPGESLNEP